jgi:ribosome recycling factor
MHIKFEQANEKFLGTLEHLKAELSSVRAGRANTALVENILIDAYGQKLPLKQLANIIVADPSLLIVQPWDKGNMETIKKTIEFSDLGINPTVDSENIRLPIPSLTEERRVEFVKLMKTKLEEARITVRQIRKDIIIALDDDKEKGLLTEDTHKRQLKDLQDIVDKTNLKIEEIGKEKEADLMRV